jgi:DNA-binding XRE family transcriptional regulator
MYQCLTQLRLSRMSRSRGGTKALAARLGMSLAVLGAVERGDLRCPPKWKPMISEALGLPVDALFDERGFALVARRLPEEAVANV